MRLLKDSTPEALAASALVLALALAPAGARAETNKPEVAMADAARELFVQAVELKEKKQYAECHAKARAAYAIHKHNQLTGIIGECAHRIGKWRETAEMLELFLAEYETKRAPQHVAAWYAQLKEAKSKIAVVDVSVLPGTATLRVGTAVVGTGSVRLFLDPGEVTVRAEAAEHKAQAVTETVKAGEERKLTIRLEKLGGPEGPDGVSWPKWPLVGVGAGLAAVGLGVGIGLLVAGDGRLGEARALGAGLGQSDCAGAGPPAACAQIRQANRDGDTLLNAGFWAALGGGVFAVTTVVLAVVPAGHRGSSRALFVSPTLGGLLVNGSF